MADDDTEERRRQDLQDLEFYGQRVRPNASDLLRTNEFYSKNNIISHHSDRSHERGRGVEGLRTPASLAEVYSDSRYGSERREGETLQAAATKAKTEIVWLLVSAAIILGVAGRTGSVRRAIEALIF